MVQIDDRILQYLADHGRSSAWQIAFDVDLRNRRVRNRCRVLAYAGFVAHHDRAGLDGHWSLTTWGEQYLAGVVDADLYRPLPRMRPAYATRPDWWGGFS